MDCRPLVLGSETGVRLNKGIDLTGLGLNNDQLAVLEVLSAELFNTIQYLCDEAMTRSKETIKSLYDSAEELHNLVSNCLSIYFKLSSVHDSSIQRLIRVNMSNNFMPGYRNALMNGASGFSVRIFGSDKAVLKRLQRRSKGKNKSKGKTKDSSLSV